ncbi:MAG: PIN domain protein [Spirochaetes bacterium]|nr:PIN domain protein [Spirochaetota bacterium]
MTVYLDNCCFNRPYDDQNHLSIHLETQAKLAIQELVKDKNILLMWSFILDFENDANPDKIIKNEISLWRKNTVFIITKNDNILNMAKKITNLGFGKKDALHIASAIEGKANYFITVDKGVLGKRGLIDNTVVCSPIEFINYLEENNNDI